MIPYFEWTQLQIGPLTLYVWGFFVALGILLGLQVSRWFGRQKGLRDDLVVDAGMWGVLGGIIGARLGYVFFYNPATFIANPLEIVAVWDGGMSMVGGLIGAILAIVLILRKAKVPMFEYLDALVFGLPLGYGCGRIGCFLIHDHPGTVTHFVLGVKYPDGVVRHDHGLYLSIFGFVLAGIFLAAYKWAGKRNKKIPPGTWVASYFILYGLLRLWLDFYRVRDAVYAGLTPAQWISLTFILGGISLLSYINKK